MGWLSLGSKILPKALNMGAKATSSLTKGTFSAAAGLLKGGAALLTNTAQHPVRNIAAGVAGWAALKSVQTGESFGTAYGEKSREVANTAIDFVADAGKSFTKPSNDDSVGKVAQQVTDVYDSTTNTLGEIKTSLSESKGILGTLGDTLKGITNFMGNLFNGNGANMFGNFFNNMTSGNVSGLGIGALILGGYMMFGRTGLLGKIGGALLAMMMIGSNSQQQQQNQVMAQSVGQQQSEEQSRGMHR